MKLRMITAIKMMTFLIVKLEVQVTWMITTIVTTIKM